MRLIDADKLESGEVIIPTENGGYEYVEVFYKDDVDNAPSVDAVEVVRCKDCKWWTKQSDSPQGRCELFHHYPTGGWYCANGGREDETN